VETPVDLMIQNGTVLTMDPHNTVIENGSVCVQGERITHVGEKPAESHALMTIDARGGLILPGLVNGHTHAAMTLFRGLADDLPLMEWLNDYIFRVERKMDGDFVYVGTLLACAEMILSGTTTFCDMYLFENETAAAASQAGMRCLVGEVLYDFPSPNYGPVEKGFEYTESLIERWKDHPLVNIAVEPHSLFTCSPELLQQAGHLALRHEVPLILHLAETADEVRQIRARHGKAPVEHLSSLGLLGPHLIADHCVHVHASDLETLARHGVRVIHNPESNMKLASGIAPVVDMLECGITVGLGTDGCASNNNLDLFAEMDTLAKLHKIRTMDATAIDAVTALRMGTIEGARALGMEREIGSLERGKKADIIVIDLDRPHLTPLYNPFSQVVYAAKGSDVSHTIINGRLVMAHGNLLSIDLAELLNRARDKARLVRSWVNGKGSCNLD
jgi:5-methylthioadenosine/S-adenosylhomocysteine deaminase